jgi:hypothetical protein
VLNAVFNLIGTRRKVASGNPHTIVSITDDGVGNALVTTEAPHGLTFGDYVFVSGTRPVRRLVDRRQPDSDDVPHSRHCPGQRRPLHRLIGRHLGRSYAAR